MNSMFDTVLAPLEWVVAWLMVGFHRIFTAIGLPAASGLTWALSIVGLVVVSHREQAQARPAPAAQTQEAGQAGRA